MGDFASQTTTYAGSMRPDGNDGRSGIRATIDAGHRAVKDHRPRLVTRNPVRNRTADR